jgi:peroxiredoxin
VHLSDLEGHWAIMLFTKDRRALPPFKGIDRELRNLGARLFCVSTDGTSALKAHAVREQIPFVLLSDPTGQVSQLYGMYDSGERAIEPGIVVLDPRGVVRMKQIDQTLQPDGVLQVVERILGER